MINGFTEYTVEEFGEPDNIIFTFRPVPVGKDCRRIGIEEAVQCSSVEGSESDIQLLFSAGRAPCGDIATEIFRVLNELGADVAKARYFCSESQTPARPGTIDSPDEVKP